MTPTATPLTLVNNITLQQGRDYTRAWREGSPSKKINFVGFVKAFNISASDIDQLRLLIPEGGSCRAYLAIDELTSPAAKLVMVPVNENGLDILSIEGGDGADESQSTIFDFTTPCPSQCDTSSPLYGPQ